MHPFKTEWCLSTIRKIVFKNTKKRFNPFRSGQCLSTVKDFEKSKNNKSVNPFRTGRCLSTIVNGLNNSLFGLNPFRSGQCLSTLGETKTVNTTESQSLSNRAMSFDKILRRMGGSVCIVSIPFEQGDVFRQNWLHYSQQI